MKLSLAFEFPRIWDSCYSKGWEKL